MNNIYGRPTKKNEHELNGWINEYDTIMGDYSVDIIL